MKSVLIITNSKDLTVDYIINKYNHKIAFFRFNTDKFYDYDIKIVNNGSSYIRNNETNLLVNINDVDALYYRKITLPSLKKYERKYWSLMYREIMTVIDGVAEIAGNIALTRPSILRKADNKIVQMNCAKKLGFKTPESLITNSDFAADEFCNLNYKSIVKPVSAGRIIEEGKIGVIQTNLVNKGENIQDLELSPAYFQNYIEKDSEIRLTIVGDKLFGVNISSTNKIDWRKKDARLEYQKTDIPKEVAEICFKMMKELGISFAAFDFIVRDGSYIFLELNANGQWFWLEELLKLNISGAIVDFLLGEHI